MNSSVKSPTVSLSELAEQRKWLPPTYFVKNLGSERCCVVLVDGVEWARETFVCSSDDEAKDKIAEVALQSILESDVKSEEKEESSSKLSSQQPKQKDDGSSIKSMKPSGDNNEAGKMPSEYVRNPHAMQTPMQLLKEFTAIKSWPEPKYSPCGTQQNGFLCTVTVNGVEYKPDAIAGAPRCSSIEEATNQIAVECLKKLLSSSTENCQAKAAPKSEEWKPNPLWQNGKRKLDASSEDLPPSNAKKPYESVQSRRGNVPVPEYIMEDESAAASASLRTAMLTPKNLYPCEVIPTGKREVEDRINLLNELLQLRGWGQANINVEHIEHLSTRELDNLNTYFCKVSVDGKVWAAKYLKCRNQKEARREIAELCRVNILIDKPPSSEGPYELPPNISVAAEGAAITVRCSSGPNSLKATSDVKPKPIVQSLNAEVKAPQASPAPLQPKDDTAEAASRELLEFEIIPRESEKKKNRIPLLHGLVKHRGWKTINYYMVKTTPTDQKGFATYFCEVTVDGKVWVARYLKSKNEQKTKREIAQNCRINILKNSPPTIQLVDKSKLDEIRKQIKSGNLNFQLLERVVSRWGLAPIYEISVLDETKNDGLLGTYLCRVVINGENWAEETVSASTVEEVTSQMAAKVLEKITMEHGNENEAVKLPPEVDVKLWFPSQVVVTRQKV